MIFDYANLTQLIAAKCGSMSAFAERAGIDTAALDEYLDGVTPWPQDAKDRAVKVLGIPDEYIPRYFFIYQLDPGKPKYHIDPADYIRIRDVYNNAADMRWAKQIADIYGCRPTNPLDFYTFIADVFCAGYLSAQLAAAKAD